MYTLESVQEKKIAKLAIALLFLLYSELSPTMWDILLICHGLLLSRLGKKNIKTQSSFLLTHYFSTTILQ